MRVKTSFIKLRCRGPSEATRKPPSPTRKSVDHSGGGRSDRVPTSCGLFERGGPSQLAAIRKLGELLRVEARHRMTAARCLAKEGLHTANVT
jgi:hypothetical protein